MVKIDPAIVEEEVQKQEQEVYGEDGAEDQEKDAAERLEEFTGDDEDTTHPLNVAKSVQDDEEDSDDDVESDEESDDIEEDDVELDPFGGVIGQADKDNEDEEDADLFEE